VGDLPEHIVAFSRQPLFRSTISTMNFARRAAAAVVALGILGCSSASVAAPVQPLRIADVTIVDVKTGALLEHRDVEIRDGRIAAVLPARSPPISRERIVEGRGKFLIPGLWDCHVHLSWTTDSALPLLVALGITDVRDMGSDFSQIEGWRARIAAGDVVGPRIMRVGPILNGKSFNRYQFVPGSSEGSRGAVRLLKWLGVDEIKVHRRMPRDWYYAVLDEAKKNGLKVVGHIPIEIPPAEASNAGQYMIEHTETLFEGTFAAGLSDTQLPGAIRSWLATDKPEALFATFVRNGTWVDPTLSGYLEVADQYDPKTPADRRYRYVARSERKIFSGQLKAHPFSAEQVKALHEHMNLLVDVTRRMHQAGVKLVTGTDAAGARLVGFSLQRELAVLVRAGLTPLETLQAATLNPAIAFGRTADLGSVEKGKLADLVLLDANPLYDIKNIQKVDAVIAAGRLYDRASINRLMRLSEQLADKN
jgi:imidazolonepropionase-like amidohydrolase